MKLGDAIDKVVTWFGSISFLVTFNIVSFTWIYLGLTVKHFIDPYPSSFFTLLLSLLAIDMSNLILLSEHRSKRRADEYDKRTMQMIEAILRYTEESTLTTELVQQIARNQVHMMDEIMKRKEE